ncbi:MAG: histone-like protein [Promethearchaeota archaeon]|jgi:histone H3/H4
MAIKKKPAAKKKTQGYIAKAPIRRLMEKEGATIVASKALKKLIAFLESEGANITKNALKIVKADKRKRITASDIREATK